VTRSPARRVRLLAAVAVVALGGVTLTTGTASAARLPDGSSLRSILFLPAPSTATSRDDSTRAAASENYATYSQMNVRSAGQFWSDSQVAGQWAWSPNASETDRRLESGINWGHPSNWPPQYNEKFVRVDDWVFLDGWADNGTYYKLRVDKDQIGDAQCNNLKDMPLVEGMQHYTKWTVTGSAYCLKSWGTITEQSSGKSFQFGHTQIWSPPAACDNTYYGNQTCIKQWESWWDNNGAPATPITRKLDRDNYLARDIGMAFKVQQYYPSPWKAELRYNWRW